MKRRKENNVMTEKDINHEHMLKWLDENRDRMTKEQLDEFMKIKSILVLQRGTQNGFKDIVVKFDEHFRDKEKEAGDDA